MFSVKTLLCGDSMNVHLPNGVTFTIEATDDCIQVVDQNGNKIYGAIKAPVSGEWLEEERIPGTPIDDTI